MTNVSFTGNQVFYIFAILIAIIYFSIVGLRWYWNIKMKSSNRIAKDSPLKYTNQRMVLGIIISLMAAITLMSWTKSEKHTFDPILFDLEDEDVITIPRTIVETLAVNPIRKVENPKIELIDDPLPIQEPKFIALEITAEVNVSDEDTEVPDDFCISTVGKPVLPDPIEVESPVLNIVEQMPRFPGCEIEDFSQEERKACSEKSLFNYIYSKLKYPAFARDNGIQGKVVIQFVVDTDGDIMDITIARDIGGGCGKAAKSVIENMVTDNGFWTPGRQQNHKVKVKYSLPIDFRLQ